MPQVPREACRGCHRPADLPPGAVGGRRSRDPRLHHLSRGRGPEGVRPTTTPAWRSPAAVLGLSRSGSSSRAGAVRQRRSSPGGAGRAHRRSVGDRGGFPAKRTRGADRGLFLCGVPQSSRHALRPGRAAPRGAGSRSEPGLHRVPPRGCARGRDSRARTGGSRTGSRRPTPGIRPGRRTRR